MRHREVRDLRRATAFWLSIWTLGCQRWVGPAHQPANFKAANRSLLADTAVEAVRAPSIRIERGAQDHRNVLALTKQPDHIQMVAALEVAPQ